MHYRGLVFVERPVRSLVDDAMQPFGPESENAHWDRWRPGGRYDGFLQNEMEARATKGGFNFDPVNESVERNCAVASGMTDAQKNVYFFVVNGEWVARQYWDDNAPNDWSLDGKGNFVENPLFRARLDVAILDHQNYYVVVVDAHN